MNTSELIRAIAEEHDISVAKAGAVIAAVFVKIKTRVNGGEAVELDDFGRFITRARAARVGRNSATGETINIAASSSIGFITSQGG